MNLLRSEEMGYYLLIIPHENVWEVLNSLGDLNSLHLIDSNQELAIFNRNFSKYIKICEETSLKLKFIENEIIKADCHVKKSEDLKEFLEILNDKYESKNISIKNYFQNIVQEIDKKYNYLFEQINHLNEIYKKRNFLLCSRAVFSTVDSFFKSKKQE